MLERLNKEIRRRTSVVGIFPNPGSYLRLVTTYLMEYAEDWSVSRAYLNPKSIRHCCSMQPNSLLGVPKLRTSLDATIVKYYNATL
jgi:hypothetical protein